MFSFYTQTIIRHFAKSFHRKFLSMLRLANQSLQVFLVMLQNFPYATKYSDAQIFDPCDVDGMCRAVLLSLKSNNNNFDRNNFCMTYSRAKIMDKMAADILSTPRLSSKNNRLSRKFNFTLFKGGTLLFCGRVLRKFLLFSNVYICK